MGCIRGNNNYILMYTIIIPIHIEQIGQDALDRLTQELQSRDVSESESESDIEEDIDIQSESGSDIHPVSNLENTKLKLKVGDRVMMRYHLSHDHDNQDPCDWTPALVVSTSPQLQFGFFQNEKELFPPEDFIKGDFVTEIDLYDGNNKSWNPQKYYDFFANLTEKDKLIKDLKFEISLMINYKPKKKKQKEKKPKAKKPKAKKAKAKKRNR